MVEVTTATGGQVNKIFLETEITDDLPNGGTDGHESSVVPVEFMANYKIISGKSATTPTTKKKSKLCEKNVQEHLHHLYTGCCDIYTFASEYDYSPSVPYNGFRSYLKHISIYFERLSLYVRIINSSLASKKKVTKLIGRINDLVDFLPLLVHQLIALQLIRKQKTSLEDQNGGEFKVAQVKDATLPLEVEILIHFMKLTEKDVEPYYKGSVFAFWLPSGIKKYRKFTDRFLLSLFLYPLSQGLKGLISEKRLIQMQADRAVNSWIAEMKIEQKLVERFVSKKPTSNMSITVYKLSARQTKWIIEKHTATIMEGVLTNESIQPLPVRLVIVKPKKRTTDNIIYHIHGGSWSLLSPEGYFKVHDKWIKQMGATIVSIDYSLSPQNKYPVALQEVVDAYVWLAEASAQNMNLEPLGFAPKEIVVTGDSAGGNLTMSLAIVLAEIKRKSADPVKLPKAFAPLYPAASPGLPYISASSTLLDVVLVPVNRAKFCTNYYTEDPCDTDISYLNGKNDPWFKDEAKLKEVYTRVNGYKKGDPIFHIISYESFDVLKDVPLYIQAAEFDPLLDDSVNIAKMWKGPVTFDVLENVTHGFSMFTAQCVECDKADQLVTRRLKEAIEA